MKARLGVNIDHVATLRQARGESYPSLKRAAETVLEAGAEQITIHLREDRRHIQDFDVYDIREITTRHNKLFNLEMACSDEIVSIASKCKPDWICLVPEKREEKTTEGGLALTDPAIFKNAMKTCEALREQVPGVKISPFVEADPDTLAACLELKADAVEIHTGDFARSFLNKNDFSEHLKAFQKGFQQVKEQNVRYHAGHGITLDMMPALLELGVFEEYNIGHWIVSEAVFSGLASVVKSFKTCLS